MSARLTRIGAIVVAIGLLVPVRAQAQTTIKLGSVVPSGSLWEIELQRMGSDVRKATGGRVNVVIPPGGAAGDEGAVLRKMPFQLHAASLTGNGLSLIDDSFNLFVVPRFFQDYDELAYVLDKMTPTFRARLAAKKYVFLSWGTAGWVTVFARKPFKTLDEFKKAKIFTTAGFDWMVQWYKENGYTPVPLAFSDMMSSLQTGQVDMMPVTPLAALYLNWYKLANYMIDVQLAPLVGATVVHESVWNKLSEPDRAALVQAAEQAYVRLRVDVPKKDRESIAEMQKRGLQIVRISGTPEGAKFDAEADRFAKSLRGWKAPAEIVDEATRYRDEFRRSGAKK